ncbi:hypothetical protein [Motilimonas eburnea]|uniref:hypothetical protein n=1 Tax=Motilimonas eburnea TaxID=1737488 RepID=UPI001E2EF404|nr:hypothetical protein [Motilimonas eburnea]MCE2572352.1 hypothetical protein [Motilimonas eburnea]
MPLQNRACRLGAIALLTLLISACAANDAPVTAEQTTHPTPKEQVTTQITDDALSPSVIAALRFARNLGLGELTLSRLKQKLDAMAIEQPELAETVKYVLKNANSEDLELGFAKVYARYIPYEALNELANSSEKGSTQRMFHYIRDSLMQAQKIDDKEFLRIFTADELKEIEQFAQTKGFKALLALNHPTIQAAIELSGEDYGERLMQEYINKQQ